MTAIATTRQSGEHQHNLPDDPLVTVPHGTGMFHIRRPGTVRELRCSPDPDQSGMLLPLLTAIRSVTLRPCPHCFPRASNP